jgi:hypothetical protein
MPELFGTVENEIEVRAERNALGPAARNGVWRYSSAVARTTWFSLRVAHFKFPPLSRYGKAMFFRRDLAVRLLLLL